MFVHNTYSIEKVIASLQRDGCHPLDVADRIYICQLGNCVFSIRVVDTADEMEKKQSLFYKIT